MALPSSIVTFTDTDGDEFPIGVRHHSLWRDQDIVDTAAEEIHAYINAGEIWPLLPFRSIRLDHFDGHSSNVTIKPTESR